MKPHLDVINQAVIEQQKADIESFNVSRHAAIPEDQIRFQNELDFEIITQINLYSMLSRLQPPSFDRVKGTEQKMLESQERFAFAEAARELVLTQYPEFENLPLSQNPLYEKYWNFLLTLEAREEVFTEQPADATLRNFQFCHKYSVNEDAIRHL